MTSILRCLLHGYRVCTSNLSRVLYNSSWFSWDTTARIIPFENCTHILWDKLLGSSAGSFFLVSRQKGKRNPAARVVCFVRPLLSLATIKWCVQSTSPFI